MKIDYEKYIEFGKTLSIDEQKNFVERVKNLNSAVKINPELIEYMDELLKDYPQLKKCFKE